MENRKTLLVDQIISSYKYAMGIPSRKFYFLDIFSCDSYLVSQVLRPVPMQSFHWWYILPPIIGIVPLFLAPLTFQRLGSFAAIIAMLVGQIITCFIWDAYVDNQSVTITRIGGALLAIASAYLTFKK